MNNIIRLIRMHLLRYNPSWSNCTSKTRINQMCNSLRFCFLFRCVSISYKSKQHKIYFLKSIAPFRCCSNAIYILCFSFFQNICYCIRGCMMALIHNDHSIGIDLLIECPFTIHRSNHSHINNTCKRILISM